MILESIYHATSAVVWTIILSILLLIQVFGGYDSWAEAAITILSFFAMFWLFFHMRALARLAGMWPGAASTSIALRKGTE